MLNQTFSEILVDKQNI